MTRAQTPLRLVAAAILVTLLAALGASPAAARQDDTRLDELFRQLRTAPGDEAAQAVETQIWLIWLDHPGADVLAMMRDGVRRLHEDDVEQALVLFDAVVAEAPDYAEGWNRRANAHYLVGDYAAAVDDIRRTLALEPRHFGALVGLGLVYTAVEQPAEALRAFEAALAINPHLPRARERAAQIRQTLAGQPL
ncbi:tetratricopeptide repeat protein [Azospirillum sp.]|uniref:tetratricopeptide repeat protein n=1 Tax=Azospirillum sp. TaxID=34012 RepID=UPI002D70DECC|nr:tetratricopeptide repeat protein [Azospirillum sp.]HYD65046.1 tetratricopeptide repeat protein [Azospirillum sp.]